MKTNGSLLLLLALGATSCGSSADGGPSGSESTTVAGDVASEALSAEHPKPCDGSKVVTIDVPASFDATGTELFGNSETAICGDYFDNTPDQNPHGFIAIGGRFFKIEPPNAVFSQVNQVNNQVNAAGTTFDGTAGRFFAYFWHKGHFTLLNPPGGIRSVAAGLNAENDLTGTYRKSDQIRHGFFLSNGVYTTIDHPNAAQKPARAGGTEADGINDRHEITGAYISDDGLTHGYLLRAGKFIAIDVPGASVTVAQSINNRGIIVGFFSDSVDPTAPTHGFILKRENYETFDVPGATTTAINSIDDSGTFVGTYLDSSGVSHGFVASLREH